MFGTGSLHKLALALVLSVLSVAAAAQGIGLLIPPTSQWWSYALYLDFDKSGGISINEIRTFVPGVTQGLFKEIDKNGDGQIKPRDIDALTLNDEVAFALNLYRAIDKDYDGSISPAELLAFAPIVTSFVDVFGQFDSNKDGVLSPDDLLPLLNKSFARPIPSIDGLFNQLLAIDANYDGCLSYQEAQMLVPSISVKLFALLDTDGDGNACAEDFAAITKDAIPKIVDEVLALADKNGDGALSLEEAQAFIPALTADMFNFLDQNGDGLLSTADITGENPPAPPDPCDELLQVLKAADASGNGCLNYSEAKTVFPTMTPAQWTTLVNPTGMETFAPIELCFGSLTSLSELVGNPPVPSAVIEAAVAPIIKMLDKDGDGSISLDELQAFMPAMTANMFRCLDRNGDGVLNVSDLAATSPPPSGVTSWQDVLKLIDPDGDGCLALADIQKYVPAFPEDLFNLLDAIDERPMMRPTTDKLVCIQGLYQYIVPSDYPVIAGMILKAADTDGDGSLSFDEAHAFMPVLTQSLFASLDQNGDGVLSIADMPGCQPPPPGDPIAELLQMLKNADKDGDGCLTYDEAVTIFPSLSKELFTLLDHLDQGNSPLALYSDGKFCPMAMSLNNIDLATLQQVVTKVMAAVDTNGDGMISFEEAQAFMPAITHEIYGLVETLMGTLVGPPPPPGDPVAELLQIFQNADKDGDGCLSYPEAATICPVFGQVMIPMIYPPPNVICLNDLASLDASKLKSLLSLALGYADKDGDGSLSFDEAKIFMPAMTDEIFKFLDQNGDGVISIADIPGMPPPPAPTDWASLLRLLDPDGDGCFSLADIQKYIPAFPEDLFNLLDAIDERPLMRPTTDKLVCVAGLYQNIQPNDYPAIAALVLKAADADGDGTLSFDEAKAFVPFLTADMFKFLDQNGDGVLSIADMPGVSPPPPVDPLRQIVNAFTAADADGDGCLTYAEAQTIAPSLSQELFMLLDHVDENPIFDRYGDGLFCPLSPYLDMAALPDVAAKIIAAADTDGDGSLTLEEARQFIPAITAEVFKYLDHNGDGVLSVDDLPRVSPPPSPPPSSDPKDELLQIFKAADANGDGCLNYAETATIFPSLTTAQWNQIVNPNGLETFAEIKICLGALTASPDPALVKLMLEPLVKLVDQDGSGTISFQEAQAFMPAMTIEIFKFLDKNGDGVLDVNDLTGVTSPPVDWNKPPLDNPQALLTWLLRNADADANGAVTLAEAQTVLPGLTKALFAKLDANGDGVLTLDDLPASPPDDPATLIANLLKTADTNGDGKLSLDEVRAVIPNFAAEYFARLDRNGDGFLSLDDLSNAPPPGPRETLLALLRDSDANNDGIVTLDEFLAAHPELTADDFKKLDSNGDGVLTKDDAGDGALDPARALLQILRTADANNDGKVTLAELQAVRPDITAEQFAKLDANGDGVLTKDDLPKPEDPIAHLMALLPKADANGDKKVTFDELKAVAPELTRALFAKLDTNGDGVITPDDVAQPPADPRNTLLALIRAADADQDGSVTFDELNKVRPDITQEEFNGMDRNGDGVLSAADLPDAPVPTDTDLRRQLLQQLVKADTNHDGVLDYAEIAATFPDAPAALLASIDTNHDWVISRDEIMAALGHDDNGQAIVDPEDVDCDGAVTAVDLQLAVNSVLGVPGCVMMAGVDGNSQMDAVDIQRIVLKILKSF